MGLIGAAVPGDVAKRFLDDAVDAERDVHRNAGGDVAVGERHMDTLLRGDLAAVAAEARHESQRFQLRRMQLMRESIDVAGDRLSPAGSTQSDAETRLRDVRGSRG